MAEKRARHALHARLLDLLDGADGPLTGLALTAMLQASDERCVASLVFRALGQLEASGAVHKVVLARGYVLASGGGIWLSCSTCGARQFVAQEALEPTLGSLARAAGFRARSFHVEMAGRCSQCTSDGADESSAARPHVH